LWVILGYKGVAVVGFIVPDFVGLHLRLDSLWVFIVSKWYHPSLNDSKENL